MILYNPTVSGSLLVTGSLTTTGTLTAQTLVVQTITSSVDFVTGSSVNGSLSSNTHQFTGSVLITGSNAALLSVNNNVLFVSASGNVGIGTVNPNQSGIGLSNRVLTVKAVSSGGEALLELIGLGNNATDNIAKINFMNQAATTALASIEAIRGSSDTVGELSFKTSNTTRLTIASTGAATFTANSTTVNINSTNRGIEVIGKNNFYASQIIGGSGTGTSYGLSVNAGTNSSDIAFQVLNQAETLTRFFVRGDGNVGIGTSSPKSYGALTINGQTIGLSNIAVDINQAFKFNNYYSSGAGSDKTISTGYAGGLGFDNSVGALTFSTSPSSVTADGNITTTERMRITSGGSILITKNNIIGANTTDGSDDGYLFLCSAGAAGASRGAFVQCFGNEYAGDSGVLQLCAGNASSVGYINFRTGDGNDRMRISYNGSIGAPTGTNIYNASDIRLKKNISTTTYGLDAISALNPVKFNWVDGFEPTEDGKDMLGFIAQEMQNVIPEAIESFGGNSITIGDTVIDNPLRVNEKFIIPVLVKAIQELKAEIDTLKQQQ